MNKVFALIFLLLVGNAWPSEFIHAYNGRIAVGSTHQEVLLKGINFSNYSDDLNDIGSAENWYIWTQDIYNEASFQEVSQALGMNVVRLNLDFRIWEDDSDPYHYKPKGWAWVDEKIEWAKRYGVYLIFDMHTPQGGYQSWDFSGDFWGTGADDLANRNRLTALWAAIADRYKNETIIAGYDLINEPFPNTPNAYFAYIQTLIDAIRGVDSNHLIIVEQAFHDNFDWQLLSDSNYAIDVHFYETWRYVTQTGGIAYPSGAINATILERDLLDEGLQFALDNGLPMNVGEYGVQEYLTQHPEQTGVGEYLRDMHALFASYGVGSQIWNYRFTKWGLYTNSLGDLPDPAYRNDYLYDFFASQVNRETATCLIDPIPARSFLVR